MNPSADRYDVSLEAIFRLAYEAKAGCDVNVILMSMVESNMDALCKLREFQVAVGAISRPASRNRARQ